MPISLLRLALLLRLRRSRSESAEISCSSIDEWLKLLPPESDSLATPDLGETRGSNNLNITVN
ncbi:MAG TPA: hypothetical protein V6D14_09440 [Coleofasciculaceae cyanobacterium]